MLNLASRSPVFNLCSRRRTECHFGWNKAQGILSSPHLHSAPANQGDRGWEPWVLGREDMEEGALWWSVGWGRGGPSNLAADQAGEVWLRQMLLWGGYEGSCGSNEVTKWLYTKKAHESVAEKQKAKTHAKPKETNKSLYLNEEKLIRLLGAR